MILLLQLFIIKKSDNDFSLTCQPTNCNCGKTTDRNCIGFIIKVKVVFIPKKPSWEEKSGCKAGANILIYSKLSKAWS